MSLPSAGDQDGVGWRVGDPFGVPEKCADRQCGQDGQDGPERMAHGGHDDTGHRQRAGEG